MTLPERWRNWFFRTNTPEPAPIALGRHRIYILPTRAGVLFAVVLVSMYAGAVNYSLGLGHALVFLLVGIGLVGMVHTYRNLVDIGVSPGRCQPVFVGERIDYRLILHNRRQEPRFALQLRENGSAAGVVVARLDRGDLEIGLPCPARRRGRQALGRLRIDSTFPVGFFNAWSYPFPDALCLVYPKPVFLPLPTPEPSDRPGELAGGRGEEDFSGFRLRQPSDSPRHIAWKAYARDPDHQPLLVKTFADGAQAELWLDWQRTERRATSEDRLSVLCGWALQADREGLRFGLRLPDGTIPPASGRHHLDLCLERLALFESAKD